MAKLKGYVVEVEVTSKVHLLVSARKPNGAAEKIQSEEGWREATRYHEDDKLPRRFNSSTMKITDIREL